MLGHKSGTPLPRWRRVMTKSMGQWLPRSIIFIAGISYIDIERPSIDYRIYLGPDWTPTYEGASTLVFNHACWTVLYN